MCDKVYCPSSMSWAQSPALQERLQQAVRAAQAPIFFLQAANDKEWAEDVLAFLREAALAQR